MPRYVAYSKYDGNPLPARNRVELDALIAEGHRRSRPTPEDVDGAEVNREASADADLRDPAGHADDERVRDESGHQDVADERPDTPVPPAAVRGHRGPRSS